MKPADWLRDYLSKYGSEMDAEEYDGLAACLRALDEATAIVAAEREACFQCAVCEAEWATGEYAMACENIQQAIRARGEAQEGKEADEDFDPHDMEECSEHRESARCLAIAFDVLERGPGFPASKEFADGYSLAAQEIAAEIQRKPETLDEAIAAGRAEYMRITGQD